ncbi:MAG TPA: class I SAM-dependent methyltransferase [Polyangiaceae bacterium]|nr:class I SAM-dependent methyltransferase [Polyangiaceae bacterium]
MYHRYRFASELCRGLRVLEVACGTGQGLALLGGSAASVKGCDIDAGNVAMAQATHGDRVPVEVASAEHLPADDGSVDAIVLFEAIYYVPEVEPFLRECRRVLTPRGLLIVSTTNPDLFDFVPSVHSRRYYGARELTALFSSAGFQPEVFGYSPTTSLPLRHRALRPVKAVVRRLGLVPKSMLGKALVRRMLFGPLPRMPRDLSGLDLPYEPPQPLRSGAPSREFRYLYCVARLQE